MSLVPGGLHHEIATAGEGDPLVFLHGFLGSGRNLASLARRLVPEGSGPPAVLLDLPGHGRSPPLAADATLDDLAELVAGALEDGWPGTRPRLVGHSLGGRVALSAAARHPGRLPPVVLLDIAPGPLTWRTEIHSVVEALVALPESPPSRDEARSGLMAAGVSRPMADWLLMNLVRGPGETLVWRIDRTALAEAQPRWSAVDLWPRVETDPCPVALCVRGGRSPFVPDQAVDRYRAAGVVVETLPEAGHFVHADALDALVAVLSRHGVGAAGTGVGSERHDPRP